MRMSLKNIMLLKINYVNFLIFNFKIEVNKHKIEVNKKNRNK